MDGSIRISKLNNENYSTWKYKIELMLIKEGLQEVVDRTRNENENEAEWKKKDGQAKAIIGLSIEDNQLIHVRKLKTAKEYWDELKKYHEQCTITSKVFILKKLCRMIMPEDGNIEHHISTMMDLVEQYQVQDTENVIPNSLIVALILSSLPENYNNLIIALESRPVNELTLDLVKNKLIHEYRRRQESHARNETENEMAMKTGTKSKGFKNKQQLKCDHCKKNGHLKQDCYFLKNSNKNWNYKANKIVDDTDEDSNDDESSREENIENYYCFKADEKYQINQIEWFIDSAATCHMTNNKSFFTILNNEHNGKIYLANGKPINTSGIGEGSLKCVKEDGKSTHITIKNVLYVPELDSSLLSVKRLTENGYTVIFEEKKCFIIKDSNVIAIGSTKDHLYKLKLVNTANMVKNERNCIHIWHRKMGHRDIEAIQFLVKNELANGIIIDDCKTKITCECCIKGKMTSKSFPKQSKTRSNSVLELIHTDLCGPIPYTTPTGNRYILTFTDDYSRYSKVYFLKRKNEVIEKFKIYAAEVTNRFEKTIKTIRSDNGGEYTSDSFENLLKTMGIHHQRTISYTPQQNGVAERKNRTLVEMAKCMLLDANMDKKYWAEAINTANYLCNRLPTKACNKTPFELWTNIKPDISHLQIFGTKVYAKLPDEKRKKFYDKAQLYNFVGYDENCKAYRLLDMNTNKIILARDVKFIENISNCKEHKIETDEITEIKLSDQTVETHTESEELINEGTMDNQDIFYESLNEENVEIEEEMAVASNRYPIRERHRPKRYACKAIVCEPTNRSEALQRDDKIHWQDAMQEEYNALMKNKTWTLEQLPPGKKAIGSKWTYKIKTDANGNIIKHKARLVAQGFSQKYGIDYDEVFAPVVKQATIRTLLTVAGVKKMQIKHIDIRTAFLNGDITEEIYMKQPEGYIETHKRNLVCRLHKSLYGLKQSARAWNTKLNSILVNNGFRRGSADQCLYTKKFENSYLYLLIYVDDILVACENEEGITHSENILQNSFEVTLLGNVTNFLGLQIERDENGICSIHQQKYINKVIETFLTENAKPSKIPLDPGYYKLCNKSKLLDTNETYRKAIGSLLYIAINTRPDIAASVSILSRKISNPTELDWSEVKRMIRYLIGTKEYKLKLGNNTSTDRLIGYVDADWGENCIDRKSNSGYLFQLHGGTINWVSRKQTCVSLSSTEAEYISLAEACQDMKWTQYLLKDLNIMSNQPPLIYEDNQSCLKMLKAEKLNSRTKHIDIKYHFTRELENTGKVEFKYCPTEKMIADILTKPLASIKMKTLSNELGLYIK